MNDEYRRGTVLGLTVAEIFILLIFLILFALLGLASTWEEQEPERRTDRLSVWSDVIEKFQAPEEIETLVRRANELEEDRERIYEENAELHVERKRLSDENADLRTENSDLGKDREALTRELEELRDENMRLSDSNTALRGRADEERRRADRSRADLETLRHKGQNPPCWYESVADNGGKREKAHYLFNIAVHDEYMVVLPHPIPPGRADDDHGRPYAEEAVDLPLEDIPYGARLSDEEITRYMERIRDLGKMREVRSYGCIFWVKVWDRTSPEAKIRWKKAHDDVLEGLFGTYPVKDDPWPEPLRLQ